MKSCKSIVKKTISVLLSIVIVSVLVTSCGRNDRPKTDAVLGAMLSCVNDLKAGTVYTTASSPGAPDYLSESLLEALYGHGDFPDVLGRAESISLRASSGLYAEEFAVFLCSSSRDTEEIADLCLGRIDTIRYFINANSEKLSLDANISVTLDNAKVIISGHYVVMAVSKDASIAIAAAKELIT